MRNGGIKYLAAEIVLRIVKDCRFLGALMYIYTN
jgi:hypothetical protein